MVAFHEYIIFHDIFTLKAMTNCLAVHDFAASKAVYNSSALSSLIRFWDVLFSSWRQVLDEMVLNQLIKLIPLPLPIHIIHDEIALNVSLEEQEKKLNVLEISVSMVFAQLQEGVIDTSIAVQKLVDSRKDLLAS